MTTNNKIELMAPAEFRILATALDNGVTRLFWSRTTQYACPRLGKLHYGWFGGNRQTLWSQNVAVTLTLNTIMDDHDLSVDLKL